MTRLISVRSCLARQVILIVYQRKRSGNIHAERVAAGCTVLVTVQVSWASMHGLGVTHGTSMRNTHTVSVRSGRTISDCTTCMGMCMSGAAIGMTRTTTGIRQAMIHRGHLGARPGCTVAAVGTSRRSTAGRRTGSGLRRRTGSSPWASACFAVPSSNRQVALVEWRRVGSEAEPRPEKLQWK
jgi:hypothetical protein